VIYTFILDLSKLFDKTISLFTCTKNITANEFVEEQEEEGEERGEGERGEEERGEEEGRG
jgi:hypothetical protein